MNAYAWSSLITFVFVLTIGAGVLLHHPSGRINRQFAFFSTAITIWAGGRVLYLTAPEYEIALFWARVAVAGAIFVPPLFLHFVFTLLRRHNTRPLIASYFSSLLLFAANFTPWMVNGVLVKYQSTYFVNPGPLYPLLLVSFALNLFQAFNLLLGSYRFAGGLERNQLRIVFWSTLIGFSGGTTNFLPDFSLEFYSLSAYATYLIPFYVLTLTYAIIRYRLLDIEIVIQKGMVYLFTFLITAIPFFLLTMFFQTVLPLKAANIATFLLFFAILVVFSNIKPLTQQWVERSIFRERYRHYQSIHEFSRSTARFIHTEELTEKLFALLIKTLRPKSIALFLPDGKGDFRLCRSTSVEGEKSEEVLIIREQPLLAELQRQRNILVREEIEYTGGPSEALKQIKELQSELCLPFIFENRLIGFCALGSKQGGESYSPSELFMLQTLSASVSIAFENAKLFKEVGRSAEQRMESIGLLAGGIAHDFNNMLTAIIGYLSLAKMEARPGDKVFELLNQAEKASLRSKDLTQQLLTFSKGGAPVLKTASIMTLIKDSAGFVLRGSNVKCEFSMPDDLWPVEVDEGQMGQVIQNLVMNALQAMPGGGTLKVRGENIQIEAKRSDHGLTLKNGRYVKISIEDCGCGIPEENLNKIFDPYFTTKPDGSGLGLATTYAIIKKHEGRISVVSDVGVGTTFNVYLPASEKQIAPTKEFNKKVPVSPGKILLMDDEESVRFSTGSLLKHFGYQVEFAKDGVEALLMYERAQEAGQPFDVVIMELTIPGGMGGKEAIQRLLEMDPRAKAIVSSGYSNDPVMAEFRKYGFRGIVTKPYHIDQMREMLNQVIMETGDQRFL